MNILTFDTEEWYLEKILHNGRAFRYKQFDDKRSYLEAIRKLYEEEVIPAIGLGLCGCIYTQFCDIEQETNGLITYDRKYIKADENIFKPFEGRLTI